MVSIKTDFWTNPKLPEKTEKLCFTYGIIATANIIYGIYTNQKTLWIINTFPFLLTILITLSYNKHKKEEAKTR